MIKVRMGSYRRKSEKAHRKYYLLVGIGLLAVIMIGTFFLYMGKTRGGNATEARYYPDVGDLPYGQMNLDLSTPSDISVSVDKGAKITWAEEDDPQIIGYNVYRYRTEEDTPKKVNMAIITDTVFYDDDGTSFNSYAVSAVDTSGKEGPLSEPVLAEAEPFTLASLTPTAPAEVVKDTTVDEPLANPSLPPDTVDCTARGMSYAGVWYLEHYKEVIGNTLMVTPYYGDSMSYTFSGDEVTVIATRHWNYGIMDVYVDGDLWQSVDLYSDAVVPSDRVFTAIGLGPGAHTIKLVCSGDKNPQASFTFVNLEALEIK